MNMLSLFMGYHKGHSIGHQVPPKKDALFWGEIPSKITRTFA